MLDVVVSARMNYNLQNFSDFEFQAIRFASTTTQVDRYVTPIDSICDRYMFPQAMFDRCIIDQAIFDRYMDRYMFSKRYLIATCFPSDI